MRRKVQAGLAVIACAIASLGSAPAQAADAQSCTLKTNRHAQRHEWASCVQVQAVLAQAPKVGQTVPITFTVVAQQAQQTVTIEADLPGLLKWASLPQGLGSETVKTGSQFDRGVLNRANGALSLEAGGKKTFTGSVTAIAEGSAQIRVRAKYPVAGGVRAAEDSVFLTIGDQASAFGIDSSGVQKTAPITGAPVQSQVPAGKRRMVEMKAPAAKGFGVQSTSCVSGGWFFMDNTGALRPSINMMVEAWEGGTRLTNGLTGWGGDYSLCFDNVPAGRKVWIRFVTMNPLWRIHETGTGNDFVFGSAEQFVANGASVSFGALMPADPALHRGLWAFDSANAAWNWKPGFCWDANDAVCRQLVINWSPSSVDGTYYDFTEVHLAAADPDAPITVVHEIGHFVMDDVYEDAYPAIPDCGPHSIELHSSAGCAWTEGFAEWFPAQVFNDPFFRWADGSSINLETPTWTTFWFNTGDEVEGRVAGAMIDITDTTNDAYWDSSAEGPFQLWDTFLNHVSNTFAQFWAQRAGDGYDTSDGGALASLYQNTIDYGLRYPLGNYAELTRPAPVPPHNYGYQTTTSYWSALAVRPPAGADYDLELFDDRAQTALLKGSYYGGNTVEFIATDSLRRPLGDYYPRVPLWSGSGEYQIELAQGTDILSGTQVCTMQAADVVVVRDVFLAAGTTVTLQAIPDNASQDAELFLMQSDASPASWVKSRVQAAAWAASEGPGLTEKITFTPAVSGWYGLVLINRAGAGKYTLTKS